MDRYTAAECTIIFWGLGQYWGRVVPQNGKGHLIGHVRDIHTGKGLENPVNRLYTTNAAQPFHVDDADVVGMALPQALLDQGKWLQCSVLLHKGL